MNILPFVLVDNIVHTFQLKGVEPPGFSFQIVNTNLDEFSPRARRRSALLTWQHIASLPPSLPVIYCGGFNTQKESTTGRFLLGRSREHGIVGDMRDAWPNARVRKNVSLIRTYHGFKGIIPTLFRHMFLAFATKGGRGNKKKRINAF